MEGMAGKVAIVTGAASGIGAATARCFARMGVRLVLADVRAECVEGTLAQVRQAGGEAIFVQTDVSRPEQVEAMVQAAVDQYHRLDYACNNAGIEGAMAPTAECTEENWDRVIAINLKGVWLCLRAEIPRIIPQGGGAIVNIASVAGLVGFGGLPAYCASKGGVVQLTRTAALEYATMQVRVNAICPGGIQTPMLERLEACQVDMEARLVQMHPLGRVGTPEEVAEAVVWLCSPAAAFITGVLLPVDGGFVAQ